MSGPGGPAAPDAELERLRRACSELRTGRPAAHGEVEHALEDGFGRLILLEARLQRARRAAPGATGEGADPTGGASSAVAELEGWIAELRDALVQLRTLSSPPGPARTGYGFVLGERAGGDGPGGPR